VLPAHRDKGKITIYLEENDGDCFWPVHLSLSARKANPDLKIDYPCHFTFDNGRVMLLSRFSWPESHGLPDDESMDAEVQHHYMKRRYFRSKPTEKSFQKGTPGLGLAPAAVIRGAQLQPGTSSSSRLGPSSFIRLNPSANRGYLAKEFLIRYHPVL
jgi:hypothetical protein